MPSPPDPAHVEMRPHPALTRRGFLSAVAGAGALTALLAACADDEPSPSASSGPASSDASIGKVIVVGAGPAGLTAAYRLHRVGVDVEVLEAGPSHGGRIRHDLEFADFPISLGAEWCHVDGAVLEEIVDDPDVEVAIELVGYSADDEVAVVTDEVGYAPLRPAVFDIDTKFKGSSWLDYFDTYVVPEVADVLRYDTQVVEIDHSGDVVQLTDAGGAVHEADQVIVTVPLRVLQRRDISFVPALEADRLEVIDDAVVWSGLKAFFVFDEAFYPSAVAFADSDTDEGQRIFYDAAHGQDSELNVLGLFSVGAQAEVYQAMSDAELLDDVLAELDAAFDGAASAGYVRHLVQDWNEQPYAGAAYLEDEASVRTSRRLAEPLGERVHFAGDAYTSFDDWSSVHTAARSAIEVTDALLR